MCLNACTGMNLDRCPICMSGYWPDWGKVWTFCVLSNAMIPRKLTFGAPAGPEEPSEQISNRRITYPVKWTGANVARLKRNQSIDVAAHHS